MRKISILYIIVISFLAVSCSKRVETTQNLDLKNGGAIRLSINASTSLTKLSKVPTPTPEEFHVSISSTTAAEDGTFPLFFDKQYGEMPLSVVLKEGDYNVTARAGDNEEFSTTAPTFFASKVAQITIGQTTELSMTATISSYLVDIVYTDQFKAAFQEYSIEAHVGDNRHTFAVMGDQIAYLAPGSVTLVLKGTTTDNKPYSSIIKQISSPGRERYVVTLSIRPQGQPFDVTIDTQVDQIGISGEVDPDLYPEMPEIENGALSYTETVVDEPGAANSAIKISAAVVIDDIEFTFKDNNLAYLGLEKDRTYHINNADDLAALNAAGMVLNSASIIGQRSVTLDMASFASRFLTFNELPITYSVNVKATCKIGKISQKDLTFSVTPPQISFDPIQPGNCWTYSATIPKVNVSRGDSEKINQSNLLRYEIQVDGAGNWTPITPSTELTNLTANTQYNIRAVYRDLFTTNVQTFKTETPHQVPNAGMEDWKIDYYKSYHHYKPWNNNVAEWWHTSNPRCFTYSGICNQYNSPTSVLYTKDNAISGSKTAEIRSVKIDVGGRENVVGKLLIGTLTSGSPNGWVSGSNNPENITAGRPFESRPDKVRFWIKYDQYGEDNYVITVQVKNGDTVIGENVVTGNNTSQYTKMTVDIPYTNTELKATSLYICFASSKDSGFPNRTIGVLYPDGSSSGWKAIVGSILYIDDIELLYK